MKVLFYLPVVTSWWFDSVIEPLIRALSPQCEIHVLAPAPWRDTGIGARELARCVDLPEIRWYIMDGPDHPSTRTVPEAAADIIAFVRDIAPDYVLCRSADHETVRAFPGTVRLVMEGRLEPFAPPACWSVFSNRLFDYGMLPALPADERAMLERLIAPAWARLHELHDLHAAQHGNRVGMLARCGMAEDRPILLMPLDYEGSDDFFGIHRVDAEPNHLLVPRLAERIGPGFTLIVTNHPENDRHGDSAALLAAIGELDNVVLAPPRIGGLSATLALAKHADGMILGDSKTFAHGAFFGRPMLRRSRFESGAWLNAYSELDIFLDAVAAGEARAPSPKDARLWFGFYMANDVIDPKAPDITAGQILAHMDRAVDRNRWEAGIARFRRVSPELFA